MSTLNTRRKDLAHADVEYRADGGTIAGFHSLWASLVARLHEAGYHPRVTMALARHTDYRLSAGTYTDMELIGTFGAAAGFPAMTRTTSAAKRRPNPA